MFRDKVFHIGTVLWHAWRNTIYCAMEAYKELFRYKRNEEKRQEAISCFQQIWTAENIFGRLHNDTIKWNVTPPPEFLPKELAAWMEPPIRINRLSPSPDIEADFVAQSDFQNLVDEFLRSVGDACQPTATSTDGAANQEPALNQSAPQTDQIQQEIRRNSNACSPGGNTQRYEGEGIDPPPPWTPPEAEVNSTEDCATEEEAQNSHPASSSSA